MTKSGIVQKDRQILTLRGLNFWLYAVQAVIAPFLPLYFADKGYTSSQIGLLMMIGPFAASLVQPFWGYISDRFRTVKLLIGLLWIMTVVSGFALFHAHTYALTLVFVLSLYFFFQPSTPLLDSISSRSAARRGASYGSLRLFGSIGYTAISLSAGFLLARMGGISHLSTLFMAAWIVPLILLFFLRDEPSEGEGINLKAFKELILNKSFLWFLLLVFILSVPHRMNDVMLGLYMKDLGASDAMVGWAWALAAAAEIPAFALLGKYLHKVHEFALIGLVAFIYTLRWLMYYVSDDPWVLLLLQAGACITFAVFWLTCMHYVARTLPPQLIATGISLLSMVYLGLAGVSGGIIGGRLSDAFGGASMYLFAVIVSFIAGFLFLGTHMKRRRQERRL
ncbi:MFS transporter [Paenibacillus sp. NFR01]|uniref:MFS transporter n=1 Tax=Paenibacillus sp. NFR01 TaxID=1566279 RepID=UPI000B885D94|nr:MFS transporter [Paenibacillus sp. NFR01]